MSKVSENIRKFRLEKGLTQAELGKMIGKATSVIGNWEAKTNRPDVDSIEKMLSIFNIDANTFFGWDESEESINTFKNSFVHIHNGIVSKYDELSEENKKIIDKQIQYLLYEQNQEQD